MNLGQSCPNFIQRGVEIPHPAGLTTPWKVTTEKKNSCSEIAKDLGRCFVRNCNFLLLLFPLAKDFFITLENSRLENPQNSTEIEMSMAPTMLIFTIPSFALTITILLALQTLMSKIGDKVCEKITPKNCCNSKNQRTFCRAFDNFVTVFWVLFLTAPVRHILRILNLRILKNLTRRFPTVSYALVPARAKLACFGFEKTLRETERS